MLQPPFARFNTFEIGILQFVEMRVVRGHGFSSLQYACRSLAWSSSMPFRESAPACVSCPASCTLVYSMKLLISKINMTRPAIRVGRQDGHARLPLVPNAPSLVFSVELLNLFVRLGFIPAELSRHKGPNATHHCLPGPAECADRRPPQNYIR